MKICVYGAGAIGGHVAVRLVKGGAQVSLVAREATVQAVRTRGLTARTPDGDINVSVTASGDARDLGTQDYVIVTVKRLRCRPWRWTLRRCSAHKPR